MVSRDEILDDVRSAIAEVLMIEVEDVSPDSRLGRDLGAQSLDFVEISFILETKHGVQFLRDNLVEKLSECLDDRILESDGTLTSYGAQILRLRLPEVGSDELKAGEAPGLIESQYTPSTLARVLQEMIDARPDSCPKCNGPRMKLVRQLQLRCENCGTDVLCPTGEDCLVAWSKTVPGLLEKLADS